MRGGTWLYLLTGLVLAALLLPAGLPAQSFADSAFEALWQRTDKPLTDGRVARSWMWGPAPFTAATYEPYAEAPGGSRLVQYFDKSRMEINDPGADRASKWFATNGLLVREMVDGRVQTGNASFETRTPAQEAVAGDLAAGNPNCPTYASYTLLTWSRAENRVGQKVTALLDKDGTVSEDPSKAGYAGTEIAYYEEATGHNVPAVLWTMMNQRGLVYSGGGYRTDRIVDWVFAMGYPISEPYWARCRVAGEEKDVLVQLFERRVLTYTPANPADWRVEMGNVGLHYYGWRYGGTTAPVVPPPAPTPTPAPGGPAGETAIVTGIIDGDTIDINMGGVAYRVRYIGIDTPEVGLPLAAEATARNEQLVRGKTVRLEKDVSETDRYGRLLRYVYVESGGQWVMVNGVLVAEGLALAYTYPPDVKYAEQFVALQQEARANGRGLWAGAAPGTGQVEIVSIYYDGQVPQVESDEYAVIRNTGSTAVSLSGWRLNAGDPGQDYYFPDATLEPGQECRVYTNEEHPEFCGFSFRSGKALWSNRGECGYLYDAAGAIASEYCY